MPNHTEQQNIDQKLGSAEKLSVFLHQDALMWGHLQAIGIVQVAALAAAYTARTKGHLSLAILVLAVILSMLVFFNFKRAELQRDKIGRIDQSVPRKWYAPLRGTEIAWCIMLLLIVSDIILAVAIEKNLIP